MKSYSIYLLPILLLLACGSDDNISDNGTIIDKLNNDYEQMPEELISQSMDNKVYAQYVSPTTKYSHGILGDRVEAQGLVIVVDSIFHELQLQEDQVFEDILPRLYDVDGDGALEFITIRTNLTKCIFSQH